MAGETVHALMPIRRVVLYGGVVVLMLGMHGVMQERIMSEPYDEELFRAFAFLVLCSRLGAICYASARLKLKDEDFGHAAPLSAYMAISLADVVATWCQYEAMKCVSFTALMISQSLIMLSVMLWGVSIFGKTYGQKDWLIVLGLTCGAAQFFLTEGSKYASPTSSLYGLFLLLCSSACGGFASASQDKLFKQHGTSKYNQMLYVNAGSAAISCFGLLVSGSIFQALGFCFAHSDFVTHTGMLSAMAVSGQVFMYSLIQEYGALTLAATRSLCQVLLVLVSYGFYSHPVTFLQIVGLLSVFAFLFYKSYDYFKKQKLFIRGGAKTSTKSKPQWAPIGKAADVKEDADGVEEF